MDCGSVYEYEVYDIHSKSTQESTPNIYNETRIVEHVACSLGELDYPACHLFKYIHM